MERKWADAAPVRRSLTLAGGGAALATFIALSQGPGDPQTRRSGPSLSRAMRLPSGAVTIEMRAHEHVVDAQAWGPGAEQALDLLPDLVGENDAPPQLPKAHHLLDELARKMPDLRLTRGSPLIEVLIPAILGQKVTGLEARRSHRGLLMRFGEQAPGPLGLMLPPQPAELARLPYWALHPLGVERRRADTIRAAAAAAPQLEAVRRMAPDVVLARLLAIPGVGPWTAAETMRLALGDPDAVSVGDFHLPNLVCFALAGEPRGDDVRMLELLEPYRGQRARVVMLLERSGLSAPRYGPRLAPRLIAAI